MNLRKIGSDKIKHFICCGAIVLFTGYLTVPIAFMVSMIAGFGKEFYDHFFKENSPFSWADIVADLLGAITGATVLAVLLWIKSLIA